MELVTLVRVDLKRIGSTRGGAFTTFKRSTVIEESADALPETVRQIVISIAEKHGEGRDALAELRLEAHWGKGLGSMIFNIQAPNAFFSEPYAECEVFPALKIGLRYFKLEEVGT